MSVPRSGKATVDAYADQWAKLFAIHLYSKGITEAVISVEDTRRMIEDPTSPTIVVQECENGLHVKILPLNEALALAKQHKGGFGPS